MSAGGSDTRICWLGAFAMGLAASRHAPEDRVVELVEASAGDAAALEAARRRIVDLRIGEERTRAHAVTLLEQAAARLDPTCPLVVELTDAG